VACARKSAIICALSAVTPSASGPSSSEGPTRDASGRFNLWLGREEKAGRSYTDEQRGWLMAIRDHLAVNIEIRPEDMMDAPEFSGRGGIVKARALSGGRLPGLLDELTDTLVA
jgi:type I restriction enzyme, R subunit